jgi:hypothetical protein
MKPSLKKRRYEQPTLNKKGQLIKIVAVSAARVVDTAT